QFVAAVTPEDIDAAKLLLASAGNSGEHLVARGVAAAIVDVLEVVDVEHQCRQRRTVASGARPFPFSELEEAAPVVEPGERIHGRELDEGSREPQVLLLGGHLAGGDKEREA